MLKVVSLFSNAKQQGKKGLENIGGGVFSIASGMAKRIRFLLEIKRAQELDTGGYTSIVRGRTIKRTMRALGTRGEKLQYKITELRDQPELFVLTVKIFLHLVMIKTESAYKYEPVSKERVSKIIDTAPNDGVEKDAIVEILMNFGFTRQEVTETLEGKTAKAIKEVDFDLVHSFLIALRNRK